MQYWVLGFGSVDARTPTGRGQKCFVLSCATNAVSWLQNPAFAVFALMISMHVSVGHAEVDQLANLWDNIVREVRRWIQERDVPPQPIIANVSPDQTARLAMAGLEEAVLKGDEGLRQVPLDAITNCSIQSLKTVKEYYLEKTRSLKAALEKLQNKAAHGGPNVDTADNGCQLLAEMELRNKRPRLEDEVFGHCDDTSSETELSDC